MSNLVTGGLVDQIVSQLSLVSVALALICFAERLAAQSPTFAFVADSTYSDSAFVAQFRAEATTLSEFEQKLQAAATLMLRSRQPELRLAGFDSLRVGLPRALDLAGGRDYAFAKLEGVSQVADPSGTWRMFTWQYFVNDSTYRYGGLFVPNAPEAPVVALSDRAQELSVETDFELTPDQWYGAVYYGVEPFTLADGRPAWVLFGFDAEGYYVRRKVADVLSFDRRGGPRFGAEVFVGAEGNAAVVRSRIILEYRTDARVRLSYDPELGGIVHDRLVVGPAPKPGLAPANVPDGSYDGFTLDPAAGQWVYREEYFDRVISTEPPRPNPILGTEEQRDLFGRPRVRKRGQ